MSRRLCLRRGERDIVGRERSEKGSVGSRDERTGGSKRYGASYVERKGGGEAETQV